MREYIYYACLQISALCSLSCLHRTISAGTHKLLGNALSPWLFWLLRAITIIFFTFFGKQLLSAVVVDLSQDRIKAALCAVKLASIGNRMMTSESSTHIHYLDNLSLWVYPTLFIMKAHVHFFLFSCEPGKKDWKLEIMVLNCFDVHT